MEARSKEPCHTCGKTFKTLQGTKAHKCSFLNGTQPNFECSPCNEFFDCEIKLKKHELGHHPNAIPPAKKIRETNLPVDVPMKNLDQKNPSPADTETIEVAAMKAALAADVLDQSQLYIKAEDYLRYHFPGRSVVNVDPDGACMPRAVAVCLFKDDEHWTLLSKSVNRFIRENWPLIGGLITFPIKLRLGGSGKEIVAQNESEYLQYLQRNEALYIWRDYWDLVALCELLHTRITVVRTRGEYIESVQKIDPISGVEINEDDGGVVLLLRNEHYYAIAQAPDSIKKDQTLLQKLAQYISPVQNSPAPVFIPELAPIPVSTTDPIQKKFEAMEREIRMLSLRVSDQGDEMRNLKSKQVRFNH
mgnify:FL=1